MKKHALKMYPWFERIDFEFEEIQYGVIATYCNGNVIVNCKSMYDVDIYVKPGFHAVEVTGDEYSHAYVAEYEAGMGARWDVWPLDESSAEEWAMAQKLLAGKI